MQARMRWWLIAIIALVIASLVGVLEPIKLRDRKDPDTGKPVPPVDRMGPFRFYKPHIGLTLGLDLRGGIHLVLQAQREGVFEYSAPELSGARSEAEQTETWEKIVGLLPMDKIGTDKRDVELDREGAAIRVRTRVNDEADMLRQSKIVTDLLTAAYPKIQTKSTKAQSVSSSDLKSIVRILENRINAFGVAEPLIQSQLPDRVIVELPGIKDPEKAKEMIKKTAVLQFRAIPRKYAYGDKGPDVTKVDGRDVFTFSEVSGKEAPLSQVLDQSPIVATGRDLQPGSSRRDLGARPADTGYVRPPGRRPEGHGDVHPRPCARLSGRGARWTDDLLPGDQVYYPR